MSQHSTVHITKLAAAERQLRAAIRLFFAQEDSLAVHTVAAAAYQLLADLKARRGMSEAADTHLTSVFYAVRSFRRGTLPKNMTENPEVMAEIERLAAIVPITADSQVSDVSVSIGASGEKKYWQARHKTANFLKHADRDSDEVLVEDSVDNANLMMLAIGAYLDLLHRQLLPEGLVLWLYVCVRDDDFTSVPEKFQPTLAVLADLDKDARYEFCAAMIKKLSDRASAA